MRYLLDTNICIYLLNNSSPSLTKKSDLIDYPKFICAPVKAELLFGVEKSLFKQKNLLILNRFYQDIKSLPFDDIAAAEYARIRNDLQSKGTPIGAMDYLIAAIALANNLILITNNTSEFSRVPDLVCEDWTI